MKNRNLPRQLRWQLQSAEANFEGWMRVQSLVGPLLKVLKNLRRRATFT